MFLEEGLDGVSHFGGEEGRRDGADNGANNKVLATTVEVLIKEGPVLLHELPGDELASRIRRDRSNRE